MATCAYCGSYVDHVSYERCASCGKPTNGAPEPTVASRPASKPAWIIAGVVIGCFFVLFVIGIIAAIAIPNFLTATQRARQKRSVADIRTLATAVEAYATDNVAYPNAESLGELRPLLVPKYLNDLPAKDGWGNELRYRCTDEDCNGYAISSSGADRIFEHVTADQYEENVTTHFDCDIVFVRGFFIQRPEIAAGR